MKFVDTPATGYALGVALGELGRDAVHQLLLPSPAWHSLQAWRGSAALHAMEQLTRQHFPWAWEEIEGLAHGLQLSLDDTWLWNCRGDLWAMAPDGCTTVQLPATAEQPARLSHNEDGLPFFKPHCAIVRAAAGTPQALVSFAYPGSILGHTFGVNAHGVGITVNNVRTTMVDAGVPRMVLGRAALALDSAQAVEALLRQHARAGGFHFSVAQAGARSIHSLEFTAHRVSGLRCEAPAVHANHLLHPAMRDHPQVVTNSSGFRQERGNAMLQAAATHGTPVDALRILADQAHPRFPIYRNAPDDSDHENTMATADMWVGEAGIDWQVIVDGQPVLQLRNTQLVQA